MNGTFIKKNFVLQARVKSDIEFGNTIGNPKTNLRREQRDLTHRNKACNRELFMTTAKSFRKYLYEAFFNELEIQSSL